MSSVKSPNNVPLRAPAENRPDDDGDDHHGNDDGNDDGDDDNLWPLALEPPPSRGRPPRLPGNSNHRAQFVWTTLNRILRQFGRVV